jgi:hypothetical protein
MGALLADVPHSRPVSVAANSQDPALVENLGLSASRYEGPTGITGILHRACAQGGLPSVSFWASVPHYLPAVPSAPATLALLNSLSSLLGMEVDTSELERTADAYQEQVSAAVSQDSDLSSYVRMLEDRYDAQAGEGSRNLPSGEDLARELEGFLRQQRREDPQEAASQHAPALIRASACQHASGPKGPSLVSISAYHRWALALPALRETASC